MYYREGGRQCCFMSLSVSALLFDRLGSSACSVSLDCRKRGLYLGIWQQNEFRFFAGRTYTRYKNAFHKQSPFRCILDCREQQSGRLAATLWANFTMKLTLKILQNRRKKSCKITAKSANFTAKLTQKILRNLSFFPQNTRRPVSRI